MFKPNFIKTLTAFAAAALIGGLSATAFGAATIVIQNNNAAGVGFNDTTPATPVGGNPGTTLGQQRLNVFQAAANVWGATLTSGPTITVAATLEPLTCTSTTGVLGSAGAIGAFTLNNAGFPNTIYGSSLANKILNADADPANAEIRARFNSNLGTPGCLDGSPFYLGLDNNHGTAIDLYTVLLHEFSHGFGFQTFTNGTTGAQLGGFPSIYDRFLIDNTSGKSWVQMTDAERAASALNSRRLAWDGPQVQNDVPNVLTPGVPILRINSPAALAGNYEVGTASFGPAVTTAGITGNVVQALDPSDAAGMLTTDGCSPLTNAAAVSGNIAIIDRGTCGFAVKVKNAQLVGARAVLIADNAAGGPPAGLGGVDDTVTIPSVRITLEDANRIKAQLTAGVNVTLRLDPTVRAGADQFGKALVFTPNPFQSGSSVSHWDTIAFPNQLMEPAINGDLTHNVTPPADLTFSQLSDIGWVTIPLPMAISATAGNNQNTIINQPLATSPQVTISPAIANITVTFTAVFSSGGAGGAFTGTGGRTATAVTNSAGVAVAPAFVTNGQTGTFVINATVPGAGTTTITINNLTTLPTARARFDYDGDGRSDISVFRPSTGTWFLSNSSNNVVVSSQFGQNGDLIAPADFDGDGKTDLAVFRPSTGIWYRTLSSNQTVLATQFGQAGDVPAAADYDGDARADLAVFRPSTGTWYILNSTTSAQVGTQFGQAGDRAQVGDFDGDGRSDLAVFRPSNGTWYINRSTAGFTSQQFGLSSDVADPADYDGDGRADLTVFRPSNGIWYRLTSTNGQTVATQFGQSGDVAAAADFDGDGKSDLAVFRPSNGIWYVQRTTAGFTSQQFGQSSDVPTPAAYGQQ